VQEGVMACAKLDAVSRAPLSTAAALNTIVAWLARRDVEAGAPPPTTTESTDMIADLMIILGGLPAPVLAAAAVAAWWAPRRRVQHIALVGGVGHSTARLRAAIASDAALGAGVDTSGARPEASMLADVLTAHCGVPRGAIVAVETASTNCGNNASLALGALRAAAAAAAALPRRVLLVQDPAMARRTHESFVAAWAGTGAQFVSWAPCVPLLRGGDDDVDGALEFADPSHASLWPLGAFIELVMGEVPRLRDDAGGYGPAGAGFIGHVDVPPSVASAHAALVTRAALHASLARAVPPAVVGVGVDADAAALGTSAAAVRSFSRGRGMRIAVFSSPDAASAGAAALFDSWLRAPRGGDGGGGVDAAVAATADARPRVVLLATGNTPLEMYARYAALRRAAASGGVGGGGAAAAAPLDCFALDEYTGVPADDPRCCGGVLRAACAVPWGVPPARLHLLAPDEAAALASVRAHEAALAGVGGADVCVLGLGVNGHLGFNEPGADPAGVGGVVDLAPSSVAANAAWFCGVRAPARGVTVGLATILAARRVLLLAFGAAKAGAVAGMVEGAPSVACPASALQAHPHVVVVLDNAAAAALAHG
jgi:glucosamine-6-phosphate deaminase